MTESYDPLTGPPGRVFLHYAIPSVIGLGALSSATVVTAIFMGNYVGVAALAAVNLSMPAISLLFAVAFMFAMGGSVITGKLLGEGDPAAACDVFTKIMLLAFGIAVAVAIPSLVFIDQVVSLLGANEETAGLLVDYLTILLWIAPLTTSSYTLYYFTMVDGRPILACSSLVVSSLVNVIMNWLFVVNMELGIVGAAMAMACSYLALLAVLVMHFIGPNANLRLQRPSGSWKPVGRAAVNGVSEFTNELSVGIVTLMFNWTLIKRFGTEGVAAFTVVEYVMFVGIMISYGFADAVQPLISKNLGARNIPRIYQFFRIGIVTTMALSLAMSALLFFVPELLIGVFMEESAETTMQIALGFAHYFWPAPLMIGANVMLTVFFTSTDQPLPSAIIAAARSLILPAAFLLLLPIWLGDTGVFITLPAAEFVALCLALFLFFGGAGKLAQ
ncbi:MAG: MATE family efflux transporter [Pseudomonadales bacterium]